MRDCLLIVAGPTLWGWDRRLGPAGRPGKPVSVPAQLDVLCGQQCRGGNQYRVERLVQGRVGQRLPSDRLGTPVKAQAQVLGGTHMELNVVQDVLSSLWVGAVPRARNSRPKASNSARASCPSPKSAGS